MAGPMRGLTHFSEQNNIDHEIYIKPETDTPNGLRDPSHR